MIDRVTGGSYEEAMRQELFLPLGMTSAVFESPDLVGADRVPRSHDARGREASIDKVRWANPELLRPAGSIRCTLSDWSKFVLHHLRGEAGRSDYLNSETYRTLHTPPLGGRIPGQQIINIKEFTKAPYAWPGGYPLFAITSDGAALCAACAEKQLGNIVTAVAQNLRDGWKVEAIAVNWENTTLYCDHCSQPIESAYGEQED